MKKFIKLVFNKKYFTVIIFLSIILSIYAAVSALVYLQNGKLHYAAFAMQGETDEENIIPDFSYAGYMKGGVALPEFNSVPVKKILSPSSNDRKNIQSAIDFVESLSLDENGFRGMILLKKGIYKIDGTITIKNSGVILLGEGQGENGTILIDTMKSKHDFLLIQGQGKGISENKKTTVNITSPYVPLGANSFEVEDASAFSTGDLVSIKKTPNDLWINDLGMAQYGWTAEDYFIKHVRTITNISGNTISVDIPIVDVIQNKYGGAVISKANISGRINNCGIQNIRLKSIFNYAEDENHAWNAVVLKHVVNSWVKNITAVHFANSCVKITDQSSFNTIEDCAMIEPVSEIIGGRRYSFNIDNGLGNLIQRCYTKGGRHDFVTGSRVTGPNVFLDCYAENTYSDIGPHHRWATGTLFDNIYGGQIRAQNRKDMGTGHGWAGAQTMFWNLKSTQEDIKVENPTGAINWAIGCQGFIHNGNGYWEHWNERVTPRSLYLQQLKDRLGLQAIENISTSEQRNEQPIWQTLHDWAGNGSSVTMQPGKATNPFPQNGSTDVDKSTILSWNAGIDALSHDVYFGKTNPPEFIRNQTENTFSPDTIEENTVYFWRIDEKNNSGTTTGDIWSFSIITNSINDTIFPNDDAYVQGGEKADSNFGANKYLVVKSNNLTQYVREIYLKFFLPGNNNQITKALLKLKVTKDVTNVTHKVSYVSDDNWNENDITFKTKPSYGITLDTKPVPPKNEWIEFDVTSQVQSEIHNDKIISFVISESSLNHYASYASKENNQEEAASELILTSADATNIEPNKNKILQAFNLKQNFPNPFNPTTTIKYSIHPPLNPPFLKGGNTRGVTLKVYDILGREIATLVNRRQIPGTYQVTFDINNLPSGRHVLSSGIYYCRLTTEYFSETIKMVYQK